MGGSADVKHEQHLAPPGFSFWVAWSLAGFLTNFITTNHQPHRSNGHQPLINHSSSSIPSLPSSSLFPLFLPLFLSSPLHSLFLYFSLASPSSSSPSPPSEAAILSTQRKLDHSLP